MTYTLSIGGSKDFPTVEEAKAFEEGVVAKAKEFVAALEGVHNASATGNHVGTVNLKESA